MKSKIISLFIFVSLLWVTILSKSAYLQFMSPQKLKTLQAKQFETVVTLPSRRGSVYDRHGKELAMSTPAYSLYADPKLIEKSRRTSKQLAGIIGLSADEIFEKIKDRSKRFVWIERLLPSATADQIRKLKLSGIGFVEDWMRVYPNDQLLGSTLGFVGKEGQALEGIELHYDQVLRGENKKFNVRRDARGRPLIQDGTLFTETPQGKDIRLTIDADLQYYVETELAKAIQQYSAEGGWIVVLDAKTSAIRAIANGSTFNPNRASNFSPSERRNKSVTDTFEPGSTLKTFVIAHALEKNLVKASSKIFCENGAFRIGSRVIHEAEKDHSRGTISVNEVLAYSSNIGTSKIALMMGDESLKQSYLSFGFGQKSGVDLPGEAKGIMVPLPWRDHLLANISFGQGITASPLQIANAYAAIANGGTLHQPYIVDSLVDPESNAVQTTMPRPLRRAISAETAAQMRLMLAHATSEAGTGAAARVPGYIVGGKTGTAQKIRPFGRGYLPGGYIASFSGFVPANEPQLVIFVGIDYPKKVYYGSQVAAPLFSKIASYAVRLEGVNPEILTESTISQVKTDSLAQKFLNADKTVLLSIVKDDGAKDTEASLATAPALHDLTLREVLDKAAEYNLKLKMIGQGRAESTIPAAGEPLGDERQMTVIFK